MIKRSHIKTITDVGLMAGTYLAQPGEGYRVYLIEQVGLKASYFREKGNNRGKWYSRVPPVAER